MPHLEPDGAGTKSTQTASACDKCGRPVSRSFLGGLCASCVCAHSQHLPSAAPETPILPPGFEYVALLGRGGMGIVHLVHQRGLDRYVALKQLDAAIGAKAKAHERFLREARAAARLSHPGIVSVLEMGIHEGVAWYSMEYLEGGDLGHRLAHEGGRLPWREACEITAAVAEALDYAHRCGIAHRDLKPSNVLLAENGKPKIADFGLAAIIGEGWSELTTTGEVVGTPAYLAPETIENGTGDTDSRQTDIYSLGALLFHLTAGRPPFCGDGILQVLAKVREQRAPRLTEALPTQESVPRGLVDVCARCLEKDPNDRPESAGCVAATLRSVLANAAPRPWRPFVRKRTSNRIGIAALLCIPITLGVAWYTTRPVRMDTRAQTERQSALVAILPMETLSPEVQVRTLAEGLADEIAAAVVRLTDLRVLAAHSTRAAVANPQQLKALKETMGATSVITGRIQAWADKIRIVAQMHDTATGTLLWSHTYDRSLTNLLNVQTDIAIDVALQLGAGLFGNPAARNLGTFSAQPEAQQRTLRARALVSDASASLDDLDEAEAALERAVELDPGYAVAYALLSDVHTLKYNWANDRTDSRLALGLAAAQSALRINPLLPEGEVALGNYFYRGSRDYANAKPHFLRALELAPAHPRALEGLGHLLRRQGDFVAASAHFRNALDLDPLNPILAYNTIDTLLRLRDYTAAERLLEQALARVPKHVALLKLKGDLYVSWKGDLGPMRADLNQRDPSLPSPAAYVFHKIEWLTLENNVAGAIRVLRDSSIQEIDAQSVYLSRDGFLAVLYQLAGDEAAAHKHARDALPAIQRALTSTPNDPRRLMHLGQLLGIVGEHARSDEVIARTVTPGDLACVDAFDRAYYLFAWSVARAARGDRQGAIELLKQSLAEPSFVSLQYIAKHPALSGLAQELPASARKDTSLLLP